MRCFSLTSLGAFAGLTLILSGCAGGGGELPTGCGFLSGPRSDSPTGGSRSFEQADRRLHDSDRRLPFGKSPELTRPPSKRSKTPTN